MARRERRPGRGAAATPATRALVDAGVVHTLHSFEVSSGAAGGAGHGMAAAEALGVDPSRVFKTLVVSTDATTAVAVVPVDGTLDLKAVAAALGAKRATMADPADAQRLTGYVVGGISPLGQRSALPTVVDETALAHDTLLVSAGRRGMDVELSPGDLVRLTSAVVASVARR